MIRSLSVILILVVLLYACGDEARQANVDEFILQEGFQIEEVAAEPLLDSPVAMTFDTDGSIWVVELPGYMRDIEGSEEEKPDGRIVQLTDSNDDGIMDHRRVIIDGLIAPRAIALVYGGLLYTEDSNLWWQSLEGDGEQVLVDSLYVVGGNIEHRPNGLLYNLDNWIYSAKSSARYRRQNGVWIKEPTTLRGQWGITHDDRGRLYYNDNSNPLYTDDLPPNTLISNPYHKASFGVNHNIGKDRRLFPYHATMVNRGYLDGVLDEEEKIKEATSVCSPLILSSDVLGETLNGNAFVCAPEANAVKRYVLSEDQRGVVSAKQAYEGQEFLVSKEETFRPVNLYNGLEGALYILDLRKGVIQHRAYMTSYLREKILNRKFDQLNGMGRIYRVTQKGKQHNPYNTEDDWLQLLSSPVGSQRMLAQKKIVSSGDVSLQGSLEKLAQDNSQPLGQIHALWTLEGLGVLDQQLIKSLLTSSKSDQLIYQLLMLSDTGTLDEILTKMDNMDSKNELLISHLSGKIANRAMWRKLATKYHNSNLFSEALVSGLDTSEMSIVLSTIKDLRGDTIHNMLSSAVANWKNHLWQAPQLLKKRYKDNRTAGLNLYEQYCGSCHGLDGLGRGNLAPPIMNSEYIGGPPARLALVLLHGLKGPVHVNGKRYEMNAVMPGIKDNPNLSDKDITDLIIFMRNSFSFSNPWIDGGIVDSVRRATQARTTVYTEEELNQLFTVQ